ncbi:MAG: TIGR04086 family membrane protein [Oscillospiraceae bacterium]|nr:TIGR04086 family membrane protein [Oscillospiraceae bacterium]
MKHKISIPAGVIIGVIAAVAVMLIGALVMSYLIVKETVGMSSAGIGAMVIVAISSALGVWLASALTKQKKLLVCGLTALIYYLVLLSITAVFFDGVYDAVGLTALMVILGAGGILLCGLRKKSSKSKIKIPAYR